MPVTQELLTRLGVSPERAQRYVPSLQETLPAHGIDTDLRLAHFLAQVLHESGHMAVVVENLNYSADRLLKIFAKHFTPDEAPLFAGKPARIGNRVYANRLGNGDEASGDGFRYRGRGLIQLTGKAWYRKLSDFVGQDLVASPDLLETTYAVHSAVFFWTSRNINEVADADDVAAVTKLVNGAAARGLDRREGNLVAAKKLLGIPVPATPVEGLVT